MITAQNGDELRVELKRLSAEDARECLWSILITLYGELNADGETLEIDPWREWDIDTLDDIAGDLDNFGLVPDQSGEPRGRCEDCNRLLDPGHAPGLCDGCAEDAR